MKRSLLLLFFLSGCTSLPSGHHELKQMINDDLPKEETGKNTYIHKGRPIYLEAQSYPQVVDGGHINMGGKIYIFAGREELTLSEIVKYQIDSEMTTNNIVVEPPKKEEEVFQAPAINLAQKNNTEDVFPITEGTKTIADSINLRNSSIKKKDMLVINHYRCAKPKIDKQGPCEELKVSFDLTKCTGESTIQEGFKVQCNKDKAIFGIKKDNVRYRVNLIPKTTRKNITWDILPKLDIMFLRKG